MCLKKTWRVNTGNTKVIFFFDFEVFTSKGIQMESNNFLGKLLLVLQIHHPKQFIGKNTTWNTNHLLSQISLTQNYICQLSCHDHTLFSYLKIFYLKRFYVFASWLMSQLTSGTENVTD